MRGLLSRISVIFLLANETAPLTFRGYILPAYNGLLLLDSNCHRIRGCRIVDRVRRRERDG